MGSQVNAGLEFKPRWESMGANEAVLGFRRTFREMHCIRFLHSQRPSEDGLGVEIGCHSKVIFLKG